MRAPGVERMVRYGMAVETILREATEWGTDLLVVGSHGKGWAKRMLVGSVTERLLNLLPTSLLAGRVAAAAAHEPVAGQLAGAMAERTRCMPGRRGEDRQAAGASVHP